MRYGVPAKLADEDGIEVGDIHKEGGIPGVNLSEWCVGCEPYSNEERCEGKFWDG